MRVISILPVVLLAMLPPMLMPTPATADDTKPVSSRQMRALSAQGANRQARRDLLSILKGPGKVRKGMFVAVRTVTMTTPPYGTQFLGLCRSDQLFVKYAQTDGRPGEDGLLQPYGFESAAVYRVTGTLHPRDPAHAGRDSVWQPGCVDLSDDHWFSAPDDQMAYAGIVALNTAAAGLRAGKSPSPICAKADLPTGQDCKQTMLAAMTSDNLYSVASCDPTEDRCYRYDVDGWSITIVVTGGDNDAPRIEKVDLEGPMIVVT